MYFELNLSTLNKFMLLFQACYTFGVLCAVSESEPNETGTRRMIRQIWSPAGVKKLEGMIETYFSRANWTHGPARAIIVPHAGFKSSGQTAAFAYRQVNSSIVRRIFILGPSHFFRVKGCALSSQQKYKSLFYDLTIDQEIYHELEQAGEFTRISLSVDEQEHSLENTLPYLTKIMESYKDDFKIVPILVGRLSPEETDQYGIIFSKYLADPSNLFVISSDFCHWGSRYNYKYYDQSKGTISQSIRHLDGLGMKAIQSLKPSTFRKYLSKYRNTICGRNSIGVLLSAVQHLPENMRKKMTLRFLNYSQSKAYISENDTSVSYAAASLISL